MMRFLHPRGYPLCVECRIGPTSDTKETIMSAESTAKVMDGYWSGHDPEALADDAVFTLVASGEEAVGREAINAMLTSFYAGAFTADFVPDHTHIGDGFAALEGRVVGTHTGEFGGVEATGKNIDVPLAVFYTVEDRGITEGRAWFMVSTFLAQVS
jgi:hypothetical protein